MERSSKADVSAEVEALSRSLLREQAYVLMMRPNPQAPAGLSKQELRLRHHDFLVDLERRGLLVGAGPFADRNEPSSGSGMIILRAASRDAAAAIAQDEPYTKAGLKITEILPWQRNEGVVRLEIRLADGVLTLDGRTYDLRKPDDGGP